MENMVHVPIEDVITPTLTVKKLYIELKKLSRFNKIFEMDEHHSRDFSIQPGGICIAPSHTQKCLTYVKSSIAEAIRFQFTGDDNRSIILNLKTLSKAQANYKETASNPSHKILNIDGNIVASCDETDPLQLGHVTKYIDSQHIFERVFTELVDSRDFDISYLDILDNLNTHVEHGDMHFEINKAILPYVRKSDEPRVSCTLGLSAAITDASLFNTRIVTDEAGLTVTKIFTCLRRKQ